MKWGDGTGRIKDNSKVLAWCCSLTTDGRVGGGEGKKKIESLRDQRFADHTLRTAGVGDVENNKSEILKKAGGNEVESMHRRVEH